MEQSLKHPLKPHWQQNLAREQLLVIMTGFPLMKGELSDCHNHNSALQRLQLSFWHRVYTSHVWLSSDLTHLQCASLGSHVTEVLPTMLELQALLIRARELQDFQALKQICH